MLLFLIFWIKISFIDAIEEFLLNFKPSDTRRYMHGCEQLNSHIYFFLPFACPWPHWSLFWKKVSFKDFAQDFLSIHVFNFIFLTLTFYLALTLCISILYKFKFRNSSHLPSVLLSQHNCVVIPACEQVV